VSEATIRLAGPADVPALASLRRDWTAEYSGRDVSDEGFDSAFAGWCEREAPRRVTWLAEVGGEPVGMLNVTVFERMPRPGGQQVRWGYISNVFVSAAVRNHGVGSALLDTALAHAQQEGYVRLVLSPSTRSIPFYRRAGFRPATSLLILEPVDDESGVSP